jgi:outer membrane receptor protein involved in Fe transport
MKIKRNPLASVIKKMLYSSFLVSVGFTGVTYAEDDTDTEKLDSITVTGSNIRGVDLEGAHPVTIIDRKELLATGITDVGDLLQRLPSFSGSPLGTRTNNGGNGSVRVDLRGIGTGRTLVLIDGRRTVDGGDFQSIPSAMIERVEILKEGASAIYGADAIAGVVNIITRTDMTGAEIEFSISDSFDTDNNDIKNGSLVFGDSSETGGFVFGLQYEDQSATLQSDTPYGFLQDTFFILDPDAYKAGGFDPLASYMVGGGSSRIPCGVFDLASGGPALTVNGPSPGSGDCGTPGAILSPADFREFAGGFFAAENDLYNYAPVNFLQTPFEKTNIFFNGHKDVNGVEIFTNFRYNHRTSKQRLAPIPFDTNGDPGANVTDAAGNPSQGISADNVFNPFGEDIVRVRRRMTETNREFTQDIQQYQFIIGARGQVADSGWNWEASYNLGFRERVDHDFGQFIGSRLALALGASFFDSDGVATCGTPDAPIAGCVPLNLFGGPGTVTPEMINYISATLTDTTETQLDVFNANVSGILFNLPAGPVGSAFGVEYRDQGLSFTPDSSKFVGAATGGQVGPTSGTYDVTSLYAEFNLPLLDSDSMGEIDFNLGVRYDDYSTVGSNTTVQGNLVYRPIDTLLIRATYAEVFREPSVSLLFGGRFDNFPTAEDSCNTDNFSALPENEQAVCIAQGVPEGGAIQSDNQLRQLRGGNPDLNPEQGETKTVGIAWSPEFLDGFTTTLDWWQVKLDDGFTVVSVDDTIQNCLSSLDVNSIECSLVEPRRPDGSISRVSGLTVNSAKIKVEGVDFSTNYVFGTDFGQFNLGFSYTRLINNQQQNTKREGDGPLPLLSGARNEEFAGRYDGGAFNEDRAKITAIWTYGDWTINYGLDFYSDLDVDLTFFDARDLIENGGGSEVVTQHIGSQSYSDLAISYAVPWQETTITVGINNLFDRAPPFIETGFTGSTEPATYRVFGRTWFVRWNTRF